MVLSKIYSILQTHQLNLLASYKHKNSWAMCVSYTTHTTYVNVWLYIIGRATAIYIYNSDADRCDNDGGVVSRANATPWTASAAPDQFETLRSRERIIISLSFCAFSLSRRTQASSNIELAHALLLYFIFQLVVARSNLVLLSINALPDICECALSIDEAVGSRTPENRFYTTNNYVSRCCRLLCLGGGDDQR